MDKKAIGGIAITLIVLAIIAIIGGSVTVLEVTEVIDIVSNDKCNEDIDCKNKHKSCVSFCSLNTKGTRECKFGGELLPNQIPFEYPDCSTNCKDGFIFSGEECIVEDTTPTYTNTEPKVENQEDVKQLFETHNIMAFIEVIDNDNLFYDFKDLERFCTKGILVDGGCKYNVNSQSECVPDPDAPNNGVTFNAEDLTCTTHYIHTRANVECRKTGEILDWNNLDKREELKKCPDCEWFYEFIPNFINTLPITDDAKEAFRGIEEHKGIKLLSFEFDEFKTFQFCTNDIIKMGLSEEDVISYLDEFIIQS